MRPVVALAAALLMLALPASASLNGRLVSTGSDTLGALSSLWAQALMREHPGVRVQVRAVGSSAAPTALVQATADIGPMSRPMSEAEKNNFVSRYGYVPTAIPVAVDTLAVIVHRENPLRSVRRRQLDSLFSANRRCGGTAGISRWGDLGLGAPLGNRRVSRYGRDAASGTYGFFRMQILCGGDFAPRVGRLVGSAAVVRAVATDHAAIGYVSRGFVTDSVRRLQVVHDDGREMDLSRDLFLYVNRPPGQALSPLVRAYLQQVFSEAGQNVVRAAGYTPLGGAQRAALREALQLDAAP